MEKRPSSLKKSLALGFTISLLVLFFQNCSKGSFKPFNTSDVNVSSEGNPISPVPTGTRQVKIAWDKSESPEVQGYKIYLGTQSGAYGTVIDAGTAGNLDLPQYALNNLAYGIKYYAVVKAYNGTTESDPSNEIEIPAQ